MFAKSISMSVDVSGAEEKSEAEEKPEAEKELDEKKEAKEKNSIAQENPQIIITDNYDDGTKYIGLKHEKLKNGKGILYFQNGLV